jgi:hypothetical protein
VIRRVPGNGVAADAGGLRRVGTGALADLARAGYRVLDEPTGRIEIEIHHGHDLPGGLAEILGGLPPGVTFGETICAGANGVGMVAGTCAGDHVEPPGHRGPWLELARNGGSHAVFRGSDRPNLAFRQESADQLDGIVVIEDEPKKLLLRHGLAVLDTLTHIAATAVDSDDAPLLSLQCPAQLPPTNTYQDRDAGGRSTEAARASSLAIRFSIALRRPGAQLRLAVADRLAEWCAARGLGMWLADTRSGYRAGNWFGVLRHDRPRARRAYRREADRRNSASNAVEGCVPLTLVGPARAGSTHAVLSFLSQFPEVGVIGATMVPLGGLAFLHMQLTVNGASHGRLAAVNAELTGVNGSPESVLRRLVPLLVRGGAVPPDRPELAAQLVARAGDYQVAVGPAVGVAGDYALRRAPVWVSWQLHTDGAGVELPVVALQRALDLLDLTDPEVRREGAGRPTIEYLVCRHVGASLLAGKAKLAVSKPLVQHRFAGPPSAAARLCAELLDVWTAQLTAAGHPPRPGELSVSPHESWLGRGAPRS